MLILENNHETEGESFLFFDNLRNAVQSPQPLFVIVGVLVANFLEGVAILRLTLDLRIGNFG